MTIKLEIVNILHTASFKVQKSKFMILEFDLSPMFVCISVNPYTSKPRVLFMGHRQTAQPDQTPQNAASDQVLHCLVTEVSLKI